MARNTAATAVDTFAAGESWEQPTTYHAVSVSKRNRGHFVRVPHFDVLDTIAREHGPKTAAIWFSAMQRFLTQIGQSRVGAKDVPDDAAMERAVIERTFAEIASGDLTMRGDDVDEGESNSRFNRVLFDVARPSLEAALREAGHDTTEENVSLAFAQYYNVLLDKYGDEAAARGYTPTKRGAKTAEGEKPVLALKL